MPNDDSATLDSEPTPKRKAGTPVILDFGKKRRKQVKRLLRGTGKLLDRIHEHIDDLVDEKRISATSQVIIVVVREKPEVPAIWKMLPRW